MVVLRETFMVVFRETLEAEVDYVTMQHSCKMCFSDLKSLNTTTIPAQKVLIINFPDGGMRPVQHHIFQS